MSKKIALIGSAPSSVQLAPFNDPSWAIWSCSPGAYPHVKRCSAHFELHRWEPGKPWLQLDYINWMANLTGPVFMIEPVSVIPQSVAYPKDEMLGRFGPYFFTSTLSYMFALAIAQGAEEIGLWGVDMSAQEEWTFQRSGCHYFIWFAKSMGIKITLPAESDLIRPPPLYGFCEADPQHIKMLVRKAELQQRIATIITEVQQKDSEHKFLCGALDNLEYMLKTWISDKKAIELAVAGPAPPPPRENKDEAISKVASVLANGRTMGELVDPKEHELYGIAE